LLSCRRRGILGSVPCKSAALLVSPLVNPRADRRWLLRRIGRPWETESQLGRLEVVKIFH
ncbi:unnamed protein product, partial [Musa textilis]